MKDQCDWIEFKMNAPNASLTGGVWKRQIRTVRNVFTVLLDQHDAQLHDQDLRTFLIESENIVNGRSPTVNHFNSLDNPTILKPNYVLPNYENIDSTASPKHLC